MISYNVKSGDTPWIPPQQQTSCKQNIYRTQSQRNPTKYTQTLLIVYLYMVFIQIVKSVETKELKLPAINRCSLYSQCSVCFPGRSLRYCQQQWHTLTEDLEHKL